MAGEAVSVGPESLIKPVNTEAVDFADARYRRGRSRHLGHGHRCRSPLARIAHAGDGTAGRAGGRGLGAGVIPDRRTRPPWRRSPKPTVQRGHVSDGRGAGRRTDQPQGEEQHRPVVCQGRFRPCLANVPHITSACCVVEHG